MERYFMETPLVSVITPTTNLLDNNQADAFNLLVELLDMQTYPNIEHIVIDKGSVDGTGEFLKDYKSQGYLNFFSEPDNGKFNAFNKGIMHAQGKYITFLSCDDFIHDITSIYEIVNIMEANNADFTFAPAYCRHPEGFVFLFNPSMHNAFQVLPCARQAMFFRKSVLERENYFDERFRLLADFDLIIRIIMKRYKPAYFDSIYSTYTLGTQVLENEKRALEETKAIFNKNFRNFYPLNEEILDRMARFSEFPKQLLDKLVGYFPEADKQLFYDRCEEMHQLRLNAVKTKEEADKELEKGI